MKHQSPKAKNTSANRRNLYFKNPALFDALQMAIEKKLIRSRSGSARVEELLSAEVRRLAPKLRAAGVQLPDGLFSAC